jgi:GT2 family glycosyltransferase
MIELSSSRVYDFANATDNEGDRTNIFLNDLCLKPGWYGLDVWIRGENALVSANAGFLNQRRANLRIQLEATGKRHFRKTLKTSDPIKGLSILADGVSAKGLARIEIKELSRLSILKFLMGKGLRYILANRDRLSLSLIFKQVKAAIRPNASFAFRASYAEREDNDESYAKWRAIHEDPNAGQRAAIALDAKLNGRILRIGVAVSDNLDRQAAEKTVKDSLISSSVELCSLESGELDFILPWDRPGKLAEGAIERLALKLVDNPELEAVFADSDRMRSDGGRTAPRLKPYWDKEMLYSGDYIGAPLLLRWQDDLRGALALPGAQQKPGYALALHSISAKKRDRLGSIPEILFHETSGSQFSNENSAKEILAAHLQLYEKNNWVEESPDKKILSVNWPVPANARVSVIVPTKDSPDLLRNCLNSIRSKTTGISPEIIVADNGSIKPETKALFSEIEAQGWAKVVPCPGPFNFSKINNDARRHASGNVIVLLNDDTQIISPNWLTELAGLALRPEIGAVGTLLLYPDGTIQHAGIVLGIGGAIADHAFRHFPGGHPGYMNLLRTRREVSAVTGACLAVSAAHFDMIGGLDETLPVTLNDVDFCLRLRNQGLINLWTPFAVVEHWESKSRGIDYTDAALERQAKEVKIFSERWSSLIAHDPHYHPGLSDNAPDYRLAV